MGRLVRFWLAVCRGGGLCLGYGARLSERAAAFGAQLMDVASIPERRAIPLRLLGAFPLRGISSEAAPDFQMIFFM
jgi:hypothetical protein